MAFSDSKFLFQIVIEDLKSYIDCYQFKIKVEFADVFSLYLREPSELAYHLRKPHKKKKTKRVSKVCKQKSTAKTAVSPNIQLGQSVLIAHTTCKLIADMQTFPLELSLWSKKDPSDKLGSTYFQWGPEFINYLTKVNQRIAQRPVSISRELNVLVENTSERMATIRLKMKFGRIKDPITTKLTTLSAKKRGNVIYTGFYPESATILSTVKRNRDVFKTGTINTVFRGRKVPFAKHKKHTNNRQLHKRETEHEDKANHSQSYKSDKGTFDKTTFSIDSNVQQRANDVSYIRSETSIDYSHQLALIKSNSYSCVIGKKKVINPLNYIFGDWKKTYGNKMYYVGYVTVDNDKIGTTSSGNKANASSGNTEEKLKLKMNDCNQETGSCSNTVYSLDLPAELAERTTVKKCHEIMCPNRQHRKLPPPPDERILIDTTNLKKGCCVKVDEKLIGEVQAKMQFNSDPCFCSCECKFDIEKRTRYCKICGGYEVPGAILEGKDNQLPFPCPVFYKLMDKNKSKTSGASGSDTKKKSKKGRIKSGESEIVIQKNKRDDRFKDNYGYKAPHIGHGYCASPCVGMLGSVPRNLGWLWTTEYVPGMKFRPFWKPGAINKHVLRLLRLAKNPGEAQMKKRRKDMKEKRPRKRPLLVIQKKDGEYTITMETMKMFSANKPRALNQQPYEDKPVVTYTIGRSEEENRERKKKKEREQRRLEREQRRFIQSAFKDMCKEICLKTYQQALGILPTTEVPDCPCFPAHPGPDQANLDLSCSCSEVMSSIGSDTDDDEWVIEFTPPNATFDPTFKGKKTVKVDNSSQYTYLDYRVNKLDTMGNPVPRYFKSLDGKVHCSDLGGFWGPDHKWLEINTDGVIGPDGKWAPNVFIGPGGDQIEAETGKFQANGVWLVIGVDGYVDCQGKWRFYPKGKSTTQKKRPVVAKKDRGGDKKGSKGLARKPSSATWSCFGDALPLELSKLGIMGHGQDKKLLLAALKDLIAKGEKVSIPVRATIPVSPASKRRTAGSKLNKAYDSSVYFEERNKCKHSVPSDKGIVSVDGRGNKTYFRLTERKNLRPNERIKTLAKQGISLSSFHLPCFHSFINTDVMKQQQLDRLMGLTGTKCVATQAS